jgi:murein DD-endopeptidase MepM/ murein hydrolase activator NlpD
MKHIKYIVPILCVIPLLIILLIAVVASAAGGMAAQHALTLSASAGEEISVPITVTGTVSGGEIRLGIDGQGISVRDLIGSLDGDMSFKISSEGGVAPLALPTSPPANPSVFTWMPQLVQSNYSRSIDTTSEAYRLNQGATTDEAGFRRIGDAYLIALGSFYGTKKGTEYELGFMNLDGSVQTVSAVLGDTKSDADTDPTHMFHRDSGNIVEFIMDKRDTSYNRMINNTFGTLISIGRKAASVTVAGKISGDIITVSGTINTIPFNAEGRVSGGAFTATGIYGSASATGGISYGGSMVFPFPGMARVSSEFGMRWGRQHKGIDLSGVGSSDLRIYAAARGTVTFAGWNAGGYGNLVIINHGAGLATRYAHLASISVRAGDVVNAGNPIGICGTTGNSTGVHLHFEVLAGGVQVNPRPYLYGT